jgi:hypothetical protein
MKGNHPRKVAVTMSTFVAAVIYGAFCIGYVAMLVLTERTAGRYVRGEIRDRDGSARLAAALVGHTLVPARTVASHVETATKRRAA